MSDLELALIKNELEEHLEVLSERVDHLNDIQLDGDKVQNNYVIGQKVAYAQAWRELKAILDKYHG